MEATSMPNHVPSNRLNQSSGNHQHQAREHRFRLRIHRSIPMRRFLVITLIALLAMPFAAFAQTAAPTTAAPSITVPINGTTNGGGKVDGTFQIQKFAVIDNKLM